MRKLTRLEVKRILADATQPRRLFDPSELLALGENIKKFGQHVPLIVYGPGEVKTIIDGERRWRAVQLVGITEVDAIVLEERPSDTELHLLQMSIEAHKVGWSAMERSNFLHKIREENKWTISELAERLGMKQPLVSKLLAFQKLCDAAQAALSAGDLDMEKAYSISQEPDAAKQAELFTQAQTLTREQLRRKTHSDGEQLEVKASTASFPLPSGVVVVIRGRQVTLSTAIEAMADVIKVLRQGVRQGLDISTAQSVMRDTAKSH